MSKQLVVVASLLASFLSAQGTVTHHGAGCAQGGLFPGPTLSVYGSAIEGQSMNLELRAVPAPGLALLLIGDSPTSVPLSALGLTAPGCNLLVGGSSLGIFSLGMPFTGVLDLPVQGWAAGAALELQVAYLSAAFPTMLGMSDGVRITPGTAPAGPTIYAFDPPQGGVGTQIAVQGATFDPAHYAPQDLLVLGRGVHGFLGEVTQLTQTGMLVETTYHTPFPKPTPITVVPGRTTTRTLPTMAGYPAFPTARTFRSDGTARFASPQTFDPRDPARGLADGAPTKVTVHPRVELNKVYVDFPATLCPGDKWRYTLVLSDLDAGDELAAMSFDSRNPNGGWTAGLFVGGAVARTILGFQLTGHVGTEPESSSDPTAIFLVTPTATGVCIELNPNNQNRAGHTIACDLASFYEVEFGPGTTTSMVMHGVEDGFDPANGPETTTPNPALVAAIQAIVGGAQSQRQFDQDLANKYLVDKLALPGTGPIRAMAVEVRLRAAASSLTSNDSMGLEWLGTGNTMAWSGSMQRFASLGFQWVVGDDHVFCWDLAELPQIDTGNVTTGYANILTSGDDGFLDLYVQDDTDVDYVKVWIVRC